MRRGKSKNFWTDPRIHSGRVLRTSAVPYQNHQTNMVMMESKICSHQRRMMGPVDRIRIGCHFVHSNLKRNTSYWRWPRAFNIIVSCGVWKWTRSFWPSIWGWKVLIDQFAERIFIIHHGRLSSLFVNHRFPIFLFFFCTFFRDWT